MAWSRGFQLCQDGFRFRQAQLAGDQAGEEGVAEGGEGLGLGLIRLNPGPEWSNGTIEKRSQRCGGRQNWVTRKMLVRDSVYCRSLDRVLVEKTLEGGRNELVKPEMPTSSVLQWAYQGQTPAKAAASFRRNQGKETQCRFVAEYDVTRTGSHPASPLRPLVFMNVANLA